MSGWYKTFTGVI